jgi:ketosteroid isomerase-like protein
MTPSDVQIWLDAYVAAWRSSDPVAIGDLFAEDATYAYQPWAKPREGRDAIVADWLSNVDPPDSWEAEYRPTLVSGNRAVATGETQYVDGNTYSNLWQLSFDETGRCTSFVEWYMTHPQKKG